MKYYIIAGEASGDLHASNLIKAIQKIDPNADFKGFGGDKMSEAGASITLHYREMAFMMVLEVLKNLKKIKKNIQLCKDDILDYQPDTLILIDYAGFNLRIAAFAKEKGLRVLYYISPKVWAWQEKRVKRIKAFVDRMFVILPFEKDFYKKHDFEVEYHGNPLVDAISAYKSEGDGREAFLQRNKLEDKPNIALLCGSRKQEIDRCLPVMLHSIKNYPEYQFIVAGAPSIDESYYTQYIEKSGAHIVFNQTYALLNNAHSAIVTSGTATLETALFQVPEVVIYKTSWVSILIIWPFVNVKFISLVNLIMDREVVKEFIQKNLKRDIKNEMDRILYNKEYRQKMLDSMAELKIKMQDPGTSERVANGMINYISKH